MKLFLDSAHPREIADALAKWRCDGVTTNPRHVQASGLPPPALFREIAGLVEGTQATVSVEVNPHLSRADEMVEEATEIAALSPNFVVKLPATGAGFQAIPLLGERGVRVNLTLVFSVTQALQAMRMGAFYVSPFIGWKEENAEEVRRMVREIVTIRSNYGFKTQVLVAAIRNARQIAEAAVAGADIATAGFAVLQAAFDHPYTEVGLRRFQESWDKIPTGQRREE
jgi:transaldolase